MGSLKIRKECWGSVMAFPNCERETNMHTCIPASVKCLYQSCHQWHSNIAENVAVSASEVDDSSHFAKSSFCQKLQTALLRNLQF